MTLMMSRRWLTPFACAVLATSIAGCNATESTSDVASGSRTDAPAAPLVTASTPTPSASETPSASPSLSVQQFSEFCDAWAYSLRHQDAMNAAVTAVFDAVPEGWNESEGGSIDRNKLWADPGWFTAHRTLAEAKLDAAYDFIAAFSTFQSSDPVLQDATSGLILGYQNFYIPDEEADRDSTSEDDYYARLEVTFAGQDAAALSDAFTLDTATLSQAATTQCPNLSE
jgi:hypothetical protein